MSARRRWGERVQPALAPGERLIWQGAPAWRSVALDVFHVRAVAIYFAGLVLVNMMITRAHEGSGWLVVRATTSTMLMAAGCLLVLTALAWFTERTTRYVLTSRRIIMQIGIALPATLVVPLHQITACSARVRNDHTGDITLRLRQGGEVMFFKLWPHVRPWRFRFPEPMLRDLDRAGAVAPLICRWLAASAEDERLAQLGSSPSIPRDDVSIVDGPSGERHETLLGVSAG